MRTVLPGKPQAKLQAICTGQWEGRRVIAYITGNAFVILDGPDRILQTIYEAENVSLEAIAFDDEGGKIAVCHGNEVLVYQPYGEEEGNLKWSLQCTLFTSDATSSVRSLSWASSQEILVGSSSLDLYSTDQSAKLLWTRKLANPVKLARFSYDASLVASTGVYDRLLKIWRRDGFGTDEVRFDVSYLAHPAAITGIHWKKPYHKEQAIPTVLYTFCADNILRIWAMMDPHGLQILQLWGTIDLKESIKPRALVSQDDERRYAVILDSNDFTIATENAVQRAADGEKEHNALDHLLEVAQRAPEVCIVFDSNGSMSAWGLENVGQRLHKANNVFNIAHLDGLEIDLNRRLSAQSETFLQFHTFCRSESQGELVLLSHSFEGKIQWLESRIDALFDPSPRPNRFRSRALWSGHSAPVRKIVRDSSGDAIFSRTESNECIIWEHRASANGPAIKKRSAFEASQHVHRVCILAEGQYVVLLHHDSISLWDTRHSEAVNLSACSYLMKGKPLCLIVLPKASLDSPIYHVAAIDSSMKGLVWQVRVPISNCGSSMQVNGDANAELTEFCSLNLGDDENLDYVLPVDPAGSSSVASGLMDELGRDIAISYTTTGVVRTWTAQLDSEMTRFNWLLTSTVDTTLNRPSLASCSSIRKAALVDENKTRLTIWDTTSAQLEFDRTFEAQESIQDLDWTSTPDQQSVLAVGFPHRVLLLSQLRFDYLDEGPAWAAIREIRTRELTPCPIGDSVWLGGGNLVIGAGNQLFVYDRQTKEADDTVSDLNLSVHERGTKDLFSAVTQLNGPLAVFHPQFLAQCVLSGKVAMSRRILFDLSKKLKFLAPGDQLSDSLDIPLEDFFLEDQIVPSSPFRARRKSYFEDVEGDPQEFSESIALSLKETLTKIPVPQLSSQEQLHLADIVECVGTVEKHRRSMDDNASRFLLFLRQYMLRRDRQDASKRALSWREISWAFHSNSQDILVDMVSRQFQNKMLWQHCRETGVFMWLKDLTALRALFEVIARNHYALGEDKDPVDCSLYYLALKKKKVLMNLWRMAGWHREQRATQRMLANDFSDPRWKTAALKNAYALLGKHRFEYAAAFFLLADKLKDAVNVCLNQLHDFQLAVAIVRVYDGDESSILKDLLENIILPQAASQGDRWLATWAFWMMNRRDLAVRSLISPIHTLLDSQPSPGPQSRSWLTNDPALLILYKQLREKTLQTLKGAAKISRQEEWDFIMHIARLYDRMGCDVLALDLVRNWEFLKQPSPNDRDTDTPDPRKMLRRRSSLVVSDLPSPTSPKHPRPTPVKPPQSVFEEPSVDSLLDNFGF